MMICTDSKHLSGSGTCPGSTCGPLEKWLCSSHRGHQSMPTIALALVYRYTLLARIDWQKNLGSTPTICDRRLCVSPLLVDQAGRQVFGLPRYFTKPFHQRHRLHTLTMIHWKLRVHVFCSYHSVESRPWNSPALGPFAKEIIVPKCCIRYI